MALFYYYDQNPFRFFLSSLKLEISLQRGINIKRPSLHKKANREAFWSSE